MFKSAAISPRLEFEKRRGNKAARRRFGVDFLDDATRGIFSDDLILLGAPSGAGKTQLCCNIALANMADGRRVHYIALEASEFEIERRLKFPMVMERFFADEKRPRLKKLITFSDWLAGDFIEELATYEEEASVAFEMYRDLFLFYKQKRFGIEEFLQAVALCADETDLIMIDHVHYFDLSDDNENRAIKEIAKTVRDVAIQEQKPIILVAHLRKRDRANEELCAGLDEFHGSSDLYKIATRVVTMSPGPMLEDGTFETYFRIPKNRLDGGVNRFMGKEYFNPKSGGYEKGKYELGWAEQKRSKPFVAIESRFRPSWARSGCDGGSDDFFSQRKPRFVSDQEGTRLV